LGPKEHERSWILAPIAEKARIRLALHANTSETINMSHGGTTQMPKRCSLFTCLRERQKGSKMKTHFAILATAALLISGGTASAQKLQYDSLGSPTPRPNQSASPTAKEPNIPIPNTTGQGGSKERTVPLTADVNSPTTTSQAPNVSAGNAGTEKNNGLTPSGLTPD
jgi:hypothetical protein